MAKIKAFKEFRKMKNLKLGQEDLPNNLEKDNKKLIYDGEWMKI